MTEHRIHPEALRLFVAQVFEAAGVSAPEAQISSDVLVTADARGIPSHGVARLWRYLNGIKMGSMIPGVSWETLKESPNSLVVDARGALGAPVSHAVMERVLSKAEDTGMAFGSVRNSNHFGIAGYYARMASRRDMIGICMTNTAALGVPTFGVDVMFGTNPLAFAVPGGEEIPFLLDMSTTVISRGKVEVYDRQDRLLEPDWAVDERGLEARTPDVLLEKLLDRSGGGILPLGGGSELHGGHKGFGLALMVDIFCALLAGGTFGEDVADTEETSARVSHFFGAIDISRFRDIRDFKNDMDHMLRSIKKARPGEGHHQVYYAGLKEALNEEETAQKGIPVPVNVWEMLNEHALKFGIDMPSEIDD